MPLLFANPHRASRSLPRTLAALLDVAPRRAARGARRGGRAPRERRGRRRRAARAARPRAGRSLQAHRVEGERAARDGSSCARWSARSATSSGSSSTRPSSSGRARPGARRSIVVVEEVAAVAVRHLRRGERVGLVVTASRLRSWIAPGEGAAHAAVARAAPSRAPRAASTPTAPSSTRRRSRSAWPSTRARSIRGASPTCARATSTRSRRAPSSCAPRAPFAPRVPFAHTPRERTLRHYLAAFGIESPPRVDGEREGAKTTLAQVLEQLAGEKPRASIVHVWAPARRPRSDGCAQAIARLRRRRIEVRWSAARASRRASGSSASGAAPSRTSVDEAVRVRARPTQRARRAACCGASGVRVQSCRAVAPAPAPEPRRTRPRRRPRRERRDPRARPSRRGPAAEEELRAELPRRRGHRARHRAACVPDDEIGRARVVEIGAGTGALTRLLAERARRASSPIERDRDLVPAARERDLGGDARPRSSRRDAQSVDLAALLGDRRAEGRPASSAATCPTRSPAPLLRLAVEHAERRRARRVHGAGRGRERLGAQPGHARTGGRSRSSCARRSTSRRVLRAPPGAFHPPPEVTSAVVELVPLRPPRARETERFRALVRGAFEARRKTLRNAWGRARPGAEAPSRTRRRVAGVSLDARGETLDVEPSPAWPTRSSADVPSGRRAS